MSIIAVDNIPELWNLRKVAAFIAKQIKGHITPLGFHSTGAKGYKVAYLQLSDRVDSLFAVDVICQMSFDHMKNLNAYIPKMAPKFKGEKIVGSVTNKGGAPSKEKAKAKPSKKSKTLTPHRVLQIAHQEIMLELHRKYTNLASLSEKLDNELIRKIEKTIFDRLLKVMAAKSSASDSFVLTRAYRNVHPHFADFQFLLTQLHEIEDARGQPRTELSEAEVMAVSKCAQMVNNMSHKKVMEVCNKYTDKISKKVIEHIKGLDCCATEADSEQDAARKKVRAELAKMTPYLADILRQIVSNHFVPPKSDLVNMSIYGEPYLPTKEIMSEFLKKYKAVPPVGRSPRAYNLLRLQVAPRHLAAMLAMDGTVLSGAKLVIRPSAAAPRYAMSHDLKAEMYRAFDTASDTEEPMQMDDDEEGEELL